MNYVTGDILEFVNRYKWCQSGVGEKAIFIKYATDMHNSIIVKWITKIVGNEKYAYWGDDFILFNKTTKFTKFVVQSYNDLS